jgi:hypothetical protein
VTIGETWQFLRLNGTTLAVDADRYYISELEKILGALFQTTQIHKKPC